MRTGKTPTLVAAHDPDDGPMVVIGPLAVRSVWLDWWRRRWPDEEPVVLTGRTYDRDRVRDAKLIFTHYDVMSSWVSVGLQQSFGTLVFDEAHALSGPRTKRTQNAHILAAVAERVVCATGTVVWNRLDGVWGILNTVAPAAFGTYYEFTKRYVGGGPGAYGWTTSGPTNVDELRARLGDTMIRRRWEDIVDQLPLVARNIETVPISAAEERKLDIESAALREARLSRETIIGHLSRIRKIVAKRKASAAADVAVRIAQDGDHAVVWVWHKSVATDVALAIAKRGYESFIINGDVPEHHRDDIYATWRANSKPAVLVVSMAVAPAGIDLSAAAHCVFAELDWTPATIAQALMRTFSPNRANFQTYVIADHEIEYRLMAAIESKIAEADVAGLPAADAVGDIALSVATSTEPVDLGALASAIARRVE
jgi:SWI/SNF-related matrix-associated actin-dependent regulator 1 of chromatin subfamily A